MKLAKLFGMDYVRESYPPVELSTRDQIARQIVNATKFRKTQVRLHWSIAVVIGAVSLQIFLNNSSASQTQNVLLGLLTLAAMAASVVIALMYRCPNCKSTPSGVAFQFSIDGFASRSKGIHPFPVRCKACGFYLSKRRIEADLKQQENEGKQANA